MLVFFFPFPFLPCPFFFFFFFFPIFDNILNSFCSLFLVLRAWNRREKIRTILSHLPSTLEKRGPVCEWIKMDVLKEQSYSEAVHELPAFFTYLLDAKLSFPLSVFSIHPHLPLLLPTPLPICSLGVVSKQSLAPSTFSTLSGQWQLSYRLSISPYIAFQAESSSASRRMPQSSQFLVLLTFSAHWAVRRYTLGDALLNHSSLEPGHTGALWIFWSF